MKIVRIVNGEPMYFELDESELVRAYEEVQHNLDMWYIERLFGAGIAFFGMSEPEKLMALDYIASKFRASKLVASDRMDYGFACDALNEFMAENGSRLVVRLMDAQERSEAQDEVAQNKDDDLELI